MGSTCSRYGPSTWPRRTSHGYEPRLGSGLGSAQFGLAEEEGVAVGKVLKDAGEEVVACEAAGDGEYGADVPTGDGRADAGSRGQVLDESPTGELFSRGRAR